MSQSFVLIVEDEPDIGELIRLHVDREGFSAKVVQSGRVALEEIGRTAPDLVILDLMLPDLDGLSGVTVIGGGLTLDSCPRLRSILSAGGARG